MSYLVGDISVLLAFKIQIQGAWVIVSLQKCEKREKRTTILWILFAKREGGIYKGAIDQVFRRHQHCQRHQQYNQDNDDCQGNITIIDAWRKQGNMHYF